MKLTLEQRQSIRRDGYAVIPGVVPQVMIDAALNQINAALGEGIDPAQVPVYRSRSFCPELQGHPELVGLFNDSPARALAESLLGAGQLRPVTGAQIALRFPRVGDPPPRIGCHLDGMHSALNGVKAGTYGNFTMLAVVLLSDVPGPWCGNFTVWPGTHHQFEAWFREHGPDSLLDGMPPIDYPEPVQITGQAGDLVLCHYQVAHAAGPNLSPHVRYACIYRVYHVDHGSCRPAAMTDIWLEWPAIRELLSPAS
ncbi:MAG: phytanoyl-CoA dioxygenase family protein [Fimbriimonadaceae bacterium]|nr:phytanoyl-CoA dioxygenase family protein [Fimbriimonadaceae bacterium]